MPAAKGVRIVWAHKSRRNLAIAVSVIIILAVSLWVMNRRTGVAVVLGKNRINLEIVRTPEARAIGLSKYTTLNHDKGMLFVFSKSGTQCFWMKGMKFPLDIIWIDRDKKVLHIERNLKPETYPQEFCPDVPAKYVIEVSAGVSDEAGITDGQKLSF